MSEEPADPEAAETGDPDDALPAIPELARRRGFFFQANESYGGVSGFYTYGPAGAALKRNVEDAWRDRFVTREGNLEIDAPTVTPEPVFVASGHLDGFDDMIVECAECGTAHRADHLVEDATALEDAESLETDAVADLIAEHELACPACGASLAGQPVEPFNLMFETQIGPGSGQPGYLRPETAQGMFVEFPRLKEYARGQLPFGVAQIGAGYRNEISPRNALLRAREFTMAELELFVHPERDEPDLDAVGDVVLPLYPIDHQEAEGSAYRELTVEEAVEEDVLQPWIAYYLGRSQRWFARVGVDVDPARFRWRQHLPGERAHYAADCWDGEALIDGDWVELEGVAARTDYDLTKHAEHADDDFSVFEQYDEPRRVERATVDPDMSALGPRFGDDAPAVADALQALAEAEPETFETDDGDGSGAEATVTVELDGEPVEVDVADANFAVETESESGEHVRPHVIEPAFGVGRTVYAALAHNYERDEVDGERRNVLRLPAEVAPTTVGVFPLMDRDGMGERARELAEELREAGLAVSYDDSGNIGRRYRRQDEVGTPYCVTVDYETVEGADDAEDGEDLIETVTVRDRDTTEQRRVATDELAAHLIALRDGERDFDGD